MKPYMKPYRYARHSPLVQSATEPTVRPSTILDESTTQRNQQSDTRTPSATQRNADHSPGRQPLQYSNAFRILKIHAGKEDAPIECNLLVRRLHSGGSASSTSSALIDPEPFDALSYHWGLREGNCFVKILADSEAFHIHIRPNLDSALRHLRKENEPVYIWVSTSRRVLLSPHSVVI